MASVLFRLLMLVKPLIPVMMITVCTGVLGFLCAIGITVLGSYGILIILNLYDGMELKYVIAAIALCAVFRSVLRYCEQSTGHYIAFKLLASIRDSVFKALRRLCPAKLEVKDKGNLISIITTDIELLEVFYAHTIAPISIAIITSLIMAAFIAIHNIWLGLISVMAYLTVGFVIPYIASSVGRAKGREFRRQFGDMNSFVLDSLRGLRETIQYNNGNQRLEKMVGMIDGLSGRELELKLQEGATRGITNSAILLFSLAILVAGVVLEEQGQVSFQSVLIATMSLMSSFGPVAALSALSANLNQTIASGERVLAILDETPQVEENTDGSNVETGEAECRDVTFGYSDEVILDHVNLKIPEHSLLGISGRSGSGKSTLLRLLMRFWDCSSGSITISNKEIKDVRTSSLRDLEGYVTQDTVLFNETIEDNIKVGKLSATHEEVVAAAKKASIHEFIMTLPNGYDTKVGELGDRLSGGERQRIGIARAFLHDSPLMLLDEPTSNLDSLNEAIIIDSILNERKDKTVVLVSHRKSTMSAADMIFSMAKGRLS